MHGAKPTIPGTPPDTPDTETLARIRRKAEEYRQRHPSSGPSVFTLPDPLALVDPESQHYPHVTRR